MVSSQVCEAAFASPVGLTAVSHSLQSLEAPQEYTRGIRVAYVFFTALLHMAPFLQNLNLHVHIFV